jgi:hypothetical protein
VAGEIGWTLLPRAVKPAAAGRSPVVTYDHAGTRRASALRGASELGDCPFSY